MCCPSCGDQAGPLPTLCVNYKQNHLLNPPDYDPPFLAVFTGRVRTFKPEVVLEDLTSNQKRNLMLAQVGLSLRGIPVVFHK